MFNLTKNLFRTTPLARSFSSFKSEVYEKVGLSHGNLIRNASVGELYEIALSKIKPSDPKTRMNSLSNTGALCAYSGQKTGRSPTDKRIVKDDLTEEDIWWGKVNIPLSTESYRKLETTAIDYLQNRPRLYVVDGYAGWDPLSRIRVRITCSRAYHALFMRNMLIVPTKEELKRDFSGDVDFDVFNAGEFSAPQIEGVTTKTCIAVNFKEKRMTILGTQYAGEMKKGVFGVMHYLMPKKGIVSLHASANEGINGDVTLLFGLSGTGKTTLSADPKRRLIGDDEHCWSDKGVFNIEGGCYAKCVNLSAEKEPEIFNAIKFGAVLENVEFKDSHEREVDFTDTHITENTRVSYPLEFIPHVKIPAVGGHPKNIIFLTCDAYGVLPPVARLNDAQAMYHFISGYTAKVAGTEVGVKEPTATFSACFGEAFLPLHPTLYAEMLAEKMNKHHADAWLVNTGWSGGKYGQGKRMDLKITRAIIDAIHSGELSKAEYQKMDFFGLDIPKQIQGLNTQILNPRNTWKNKEDYDEAAKHLASLFQQNFEKYADKASPETKAAGPTTK